MSRNFQIVNMPFPIRTNLVDGRHRG
jgi:hypothetical protein